MINATMGMQSPSFRSIYRMPLTRVDKIEDPAEKQAMTEAAIQSTVLGFNASIDYPRISKDQAFAYFKVDDKNDAKFEQAHKNIVDNCNKMFNTDIAKKMYVEKANEADYLAADIVR